MFSIFGGRLSWAGKAAAIFGFIFISNYLTAQDRCLQRTVLVNVADAHGMPIQGLTGNDFRASYRKHEIKISNFTYAEAPRRVILMLDISGSMIAKDNPDKWNTARSAALELLGSADAGMQISFMAFANKIPVRIASSDGRNAIAAWLTGKAGADPRGLSGPTALFDAVLEALKQLQPARPGDAIFVITDGGNDSGSDSIQHVSRALQYSGVRLFALVPEDSFRTIEEQSAYEAFGKLVVNTGGSVQQVRPVKVDWSSTQLSGHGAAFTRIGSTIAAIAAQISGVYSVTLELPESPSKPESWKLEVVSPGNRKKKELTLAYPHEILPCSSQP